MSGLERLNIIGVGQHASTSDFTTSPSTSQLRLMNSPLLDPGFNMIDRAGYPTADGRRIESINGTQNTSLPDLSFSVTGLSGGGADDGTATSGLSLPIDPILEALCGAASPDNQTGSQAASGSSGTTLNVDADASTDLYAGGGVLMTTDAGINVAREVTNVSTTTITLDRAPTDSQGSATAATNGTDVYASKSYTLTPTAIDHTHLFLDAEFLGLGRKLFKGCLGNGVLQFGRGENVALNLSGLGCTSWHVTSTASPAFSAPTDGAEIITMDSPLWVGSDLYMAYDFTFDFGLSVQPRASDGGPQGHWGFVVSQMMPTLAGKFRLGSLTGPDELTNTQKNTWRGDTLVDIGLQVGRTAGETMYIRIPSARLVIGEPTAENGQIVYPFTAEASGAATPARIHIF